MTFILEGQSGVGLFGSFHCLFKKMYILICIKRADVYLDVKSSGQMTNRFKYDLLCCQ